MLCCALVCSNPRVSMVVFMRPHNPSFLILHPPPSPASTDATQDFIARWTAYLNNWKRETKSDTVSLVCAFWRMAWGRLSEDNHRAVSNQERRADTVDDA